MKKEKTILGIDPSLRSTGFCIATKTGNIVAAGRIATGKNDHGAALREIYNRLEELIDVYDVETVVLEGHFMGKNAHTLITLAQVRGVIIMLAYDRGIKLITYPPAAIKKTFTGKGTASKDDVQKRVLSIYGSQKTVREALNKEKKKDDIADAIAITMAYIRKEGEEKDGSGRRKTKVVP